MSRCAAAAGELLTTTDYDAVDRVVSGKTPDNAMSTSVYAGEKTTVSDAAGKSRELYSNALGQLARVVEAPGSGTAYQTYYRYDGLSNLAGVCHGAAFSSENCPVGGVGRRFRYDTLGRLRLAENPENGVHTYDYDPNGNLTSKSSPKPVTVTHTYDEINRLAAKSYSDGTPAVTLCYDSAATGGGAAVPYSTGRLVSLGNAIGTTRYGGYDMLGRVKSSTQTVTGPPVMSYAFSDYSYDLLGNIISMTYPTGRVLQTDYDGAGRQEKVGRYAGGVLTPYAETGGYAPHGAIETLKLGWGRARN